MVVSVVLSLGTWVVTVLWYYGRLSRARVLAVEKQNDTIINAVNAHTTTTVASIASSSNQKVGALFEEVHDALARQDRNREREALAVARAVAELTDEKSRA
jgi:hypothetical protein